MGLYGSLYDCAIHVATLHAWLITSFQPPLDLHYTLAFSLI